MQNPQYTQSLLRHDVISIRETIYDTGIDGIKEMQDYLTDKYVAGGYVLPFQR